LLILNAILANLFITLPSTTNKPKILLLSAYDAKSHQFWRKSLVKGLSCFDWTEIALADRYFSWRVRGNSLTFAYQYQELLNQPYDCLLATSMVDLSALRGFVPQLAKIPNILYFHENQFAYPIDENSDRASMNAINAQLTSIYSMLCADLLLFNSHYNRQTFIRGVKHLLKKLPDGVPKDLINGVSEKIRILPVPISKKISKQSPLMFKTAINEFEIIWNHRWEYDKQPEIFFDALKIVKAKGYTFKLHVLGQSFRQKPSCFEKAKEYFIDDILTWGYQSAEKYESILSQATLVISSANHDFQGLSMLQAIEQGCIPIAPNRLAYPEYIDPQYLYSVDGKINEALSLANKLIEIMDEFKTNLHSQYAGNNVDAKMALINLIKPYYQQTLLPKYKELIEQQIDSFNQSSNGN